VLGYCGVCWLWRFGSTTDSTQESDRVCFVTLAGVSVTAHTYHNNTRRHGLWNAVSSERSCGSLGLAAMPDTPGSRIVGPKARRKKWSVHPSSGYLASRPFRTLNWLAWGTRHAREVSLWRHSCDLHVQGRLWRTRGPQRGSVKQLPRLRARTGHAPCTYAGSSFRSLALLYCAFALSRASASAIRAAAVPYTSPVDQAYQARTR